MDSTTSLLERLATLPDPRSKQGQRYPLPAVLGLAAVLTSLGSGLRDDAAIMLFTATDPTPQAPA